VTAFDVSEALRFPRACVASPHHLASAVGLAVLADGGNAVDAAIGANLTLGVVAPYLCGYGGDLFALVRREGEALWAYNGSGRAPAAATVDAVRAALDGSARAGPGGGAGRLPAEGALSVTVPGAVDGWFALLERFGTRSFGALAEPARVYAASGFALSRRGAAAIERSRERFGRGATGWWATYGATSPGTVLRQRALARTIRTLADDGPDAFYRGAIGRDVAACVQEAGGLLSTEDLADHHGDVVDPIRGRYRDVEVVELPPNTQGVTALEAMAITEALSAEGVPPDDVERHHLLIEAAKLALADRDAFVTDPSAMERPVSDLLAPAWIAARAAAFDPARAGSPATGPAAPGGTAYLCAADRDGTLVSLIQSNYRGFGSGVTVPGWGINLHDRGNLFSLDSAHPNAIAPRKRTLHTLIPAMAFREGRPWLVFGTMGGDGQAQTHLQLMVRTVDDLQDPQRAIDAPRWVVSPADHGVVADERFDPALLNGLRARGHLVTTLPWHDGTFGHAHAILVTEDGYAGATDPRAEGAVLGL
jgi:gamma-glutamyltranspeptidase/glutathione hydrolase